MKIPPKTCKMTTICLTISGFAPKLLQVAQKELSSVLLKVLAVLNYACECVSLVDNFLLICSAF